MTVYRNRNVTYRLLKHIRAKAKACRFRAISCALGPGSARLSQRQKESSSITWNEIMGVLKRLDNNLSDAVYLQRLLHSWAKEISPLSSSGEG
jgi:hypothetical protein